MKLYAGIGSRKTPSDVLDLMERITYRAAARHWTLRSGGADGADRAFERGAQGETEIFYHYHAGQYPWCFNTVNKYHPAPDRLGPFARKLMARNALQIFGADGQTPVQFIVCWTPGGSGSGGTGQAIRMARAHNIPVYDLGNQDILEQFKRWVQYP